MLDITERDGGIFITPVVVTPKNQAASLAQSKPTAVSANRETRAAMFGCLRGKIKMADDFDAPMNEFEAYM